MLLATCSCHWEKPLHHYHLPTVSQEWLYLCILGRLLILDYKTLSYISTASQDWLNYPTLSKDKRQIKQKIDPRINLDMLYKMLAKLIAFQSCFMFKVEILSPSGWKCDFYSARLIDGKSETLLRRELCCCRAGRFGPPPKRRARRLFLIQA